MVNRGGGGSFKEANGSQTVLFSRYPPFVLSGSGGTEHLAGILLTFTWQDFTKHIQVWDCLHVPEMLWRCWLRERKLQVFHGVFSSPPSSCLSNPWSEMERCWVVLFVSGLWVGWLSRYRAAWLICRSNNFSLGHSSGSNRHQNVASMETYCHGNGEAWQSWRNICLYPSFPPSFCFPCDETCVFGYPCQLQSVHFKMLQAQKCSSLRRTRNKSCKSNGGVCRLYCLHKKPLRVWREMSLSHVLVGKSPTRNASALDCFMGTGWNELLWGIRPRTPSNKLTHPMVNGERESSSALLGPFQLVRLMLHFQLLPVTAAFTLGLVSTFWQGDKQPQFINFAPIQYGVGGGNGAFWNGLLSKEQGRGCVWNCFLYVLLLFLLTSFTLWFIQVCTLQ